MCGAEVRVEHEGTRKKWKEEKVSCPECSKVLVAGVGERPANLQCSSCHAHFVLRPNRPKIEIACPSCDRKLRMNKRPGERDITCPACDKEFKSNFEVTNLEDHHSNDGTCRLHHYHQWSAWSFSHLLPAIGCR